MCGSIDFPILNKLRVLHTGHHQNAPLLHQHVDAVAQLAGQHGRKLPGALFDELRDFFKNALDIGAKRVS